MDGKTELDKNLTLIAKSSIIVLIGVFLSKIFTYGHRIIMARYFGPETYGILSLALAITTIFATFATFGLKDGLVRFVPFYRGKK